MIYWSEAVWDIDWTPESYCSRPICARVGKQLRICGGGWVEKRPVVVEGWWHGPTWSYMVTVAPGHCQPRLQWESRSSSNTNPVHHVTTHAPYNDLSMLSAHSSKDRMENFKIHSQRHVIWMIFYSLSLMSKFLLNFSNSSQHSYNYLTKPGF